MIARQLATRWWSLLGITALLSSPATPAQADPGAGTIRQLERHNASEISGELSTADPTDDGRYYDIFTLKGEVGAQYNIRVQSPEIDPVITVIDSAGNTQAYDDSSPEMTLSDDGDLVLREGPAHELPNVDANEQVNRPNSELLEADVFVSLPGFREYRVIVTSFAPRQTGRYTLFWEPMTAANTIMPSSRLGLGAAQPCARCS